MNNLITAAEVGKDVLKRTVDVLDERFMALLRLGEGGAENSRDDAAEGGG